MRFLTSLVTVITTSVVLAYTPIPVKRSSAEVDLTAKLQEAKSDSAKVAIARKYLEANPEDIPAGRAAEDVLLKKMEDPLTYFKNRADKDPTLASVYLYGRASHDSTIMAESAQKILKMNPQSYWGHELAGYAEWYRAKSDTAVLIREFKTAIDTDPSRPEAYLYLGWVYWDEEMWPQAREVLEAGAFVDTSDHFFRDALLTVYAEQRDAFKFFLLMKDLFPVTPLTADLPRANGGPKLTSADLQGEPTVIEYWAYT